METTSLSKIAADKENLERILDSLMEGIIAHDKDRRILFFNRAAERITGFSKSEVLGKDCHEAFGEPFCGGRCSFCGEPPDSWTQAKYPLNIVTKDGERRRIEMLALSLVPSFKTVSIMSHVVVGTGPSPNPQK
ncbi:MAG: PAS domain-containing protein [Deltaproteobacteria bacterium]|nr:PAS domain-containing protein [Deltaproteobacteria bacterium]